MSIGIDIESAVMKSKPASAIVDIHSFCNASCTICPYDRLNRMQSQGVMPWSLYTKIIDELACCGSTASGRPRLTYCHMGEPLLAPHVVECVRYARGRQLDVYLNTNGSYLSARLLGALQEAGFCGDIFVSFHGITARVYEGITGLSFDLVLQNTLHLIRNYPPGRITIRGVDYGWPPGERKKWEDYWTSLGVVVEYKKPISRCGAVDVGEVVPAEGRLWGCRSKRPLEQIVILFDGRVVLCCQDMRREETWGNVGDLGVLGVWRGSARLDSLRRLYGGLPVRSAGLPCIRCEKARILCEGRVSSSQIA